MIDKVLSQLIDFIKSASPIIWETYVRQAFVYALYRLVGGIPLLALGIFGMTVGSRKIKRLSRLNKAEDDDTSGGWWAMIFISGGLGILAICIIMDAFARYLNPNYYAIQLILDTIK